MSSGYPAHAYAVQILENLKATLPKTTGGIKARIEKAIADLDPIKKNNTFMRTQKAERVTKGILANSKMLKENPENSEKLDAIEADIAYLVERVKTMVIKMT